MYFLEIAVTCVFCRFGAGKNGVTAFLWGGFRFLSGKVGKNILMLEFSCLLRCDKAGKGILRYFFGQEKWGDGIFLFFMIGILVGFHNDIEILLFRYHKYLEI